MKKRIDRFTLIDVLAENGGGTVWQAEETLPGDVKRPVALKVLPALSASDKAAQVRFVEEVRLLVAVGGQPGIATVYGMGVTDNVPWIAMEPPAQTLEQRISEAPGNPDDVSRLIEQVAGGLNALHRLTPPRLHNDLEPASVLVDTHGGFKIMDFSIAGDASIKPTLPAVMVRYAAPEVLSPELGQPGPASDLYALGHIAYELALGGKLYRQQFPAVYEPRQSSKDANPAKWMAWHCSLNTRAASIREVLPEFPPHLSDVVAKLMHKPLNGRYSAASDVVKEVAGGQLPVGNEPAVAPVAISAPSVSNRGPSPEARVPVSAFSPAQAAPRPAGPASDASGVFYIRFRGRVSGPVDAATLRRQIKQGLVSRLHQISNDRVTWRGIDTL